MQPVSDDDVWKRLLEKPPRFELTVKGVFRLGRCSRCDAFFVQSIVLSRLGADWRSLSLTVALSLTLPLTLSLTLSVTLSYGNP